MTHRRKFKVLLSLLLLLVFVIPLAIVSASVSQPNLISDSHSQAAFGKTGPSNGYSIASSSTALLWSSSSGATQYQYCYDTVNNNLCDNSWASNGTGTIVMVSGLSNGTYYWQARALGPGGSVEANAGTWWSFNVVPTPTPTLTPMPFGKSTPSNGATGQDLTLLTAWGSSPGATSYEYCYDAINNGVCDGSWTSTGTTQWVYYSGLAYSTTYSWQVRAVTASGYVYANNGNWWSFTTRSVPTPTRTRTPTRTPTPTPGPFVKLGPSNGYQLSSSSTALVWGSSAGATQYQYCYDTINNNSCDDTWTSTGTNTMTVTSSLALTTYYWQVRALGPGGTIEANGGAWWSFTVAATPTPTPTPSFSKVSPTYGSVQSPLVVIQWNTSPGATTYEWCIDTIHNSACDTSWHPIASTVDFPSGLLHSTTYSWQVRAVGPGGALNYANGGAWWIFVTN